MQFKKQLCARILSEANDLKRTIPALAHDLKMDVAHLNFVLSAQSTLEEIYDVINRMSEFYPIDKADLLLLKDDCINSVKIMRKEETQKSARICERVNRFGERTPYYEYRDTAMSRLAPFKPEWIEQLRLVQDADPFNSDVVYNNGHFMHQTTFFVGPVNFYWEVNGIKHCKQMNTGDSNYITPYWKHSFTNRSPDKKALILAITFGGAVRHAQKEFYALKNKAKSYYLDSRNPERGMSQLIRQHMYDENLSIENLNMQLNAYSGTLKASDFLDEQKQKSTEDLAILAQILNVQVSDLSLPMYRSEDEVVVKHYDEKAGYYYPDEKDPLYYINTLARTLKMPQMKGFNIEILINNATLQHGFISSSHTYAYNYGDNAIRLHWEHEGAQYEEIINVGDSFYIQPFVKHAFSNIENSGKLYMARAPGSINLSTQKELSFFSDIERVMEENICWFN